MDSKLVTIMAYKVLLFLTLFVFLTAIQKKIYGQNLKNEFLSASCSNKYRMNDLLISKPSDKKTRQLDQRVKFAYSYELDTFFNNYTYADSLQYFYNETNGNGKPIYFQQSYISYFANIGDIELPQIDFHNPNSDSIYMLRTQPAISPIPRLIFLKKYDSLGRNISWERKYFDIDSNRFITNGKYIYDYDDFGSLSYIAEMQIDSSTNDFTDTLFCIVYQNKFFQKDTLALSYQFINGVKTYFQKVEQEFNSIGNLIKRKTYDNFSTSNTLYVPLQKDSVIYFTDSFLVFNSIYDTASLNYNLNTKMTCKLKNNRVDSIYTLLYNQIGSTFSNYSLEIIDRNSSGFTTKYSFYGPDSSLTTFILNYYHTYTRDLNNKIAEFKNTNSFINYEYGTDSLIDSVSYRYHNFSKIAVAKFYYENFENGIATNTNELHIKTCDCRIFPNPSENDLFIFLESTLSRPIEINIYSSNGILLRKDIPNAFKGDNLFDLNISNLVSGDYIVEIISGQQKISRKIVVQK